MCFPFDGDDLDYVSSIFEDLKKIEHFKYDPTRVYASGFSNGGLFMSVLIQLFSDRFTAICNNMGGLSMSDGALLPISIGKVQKPVLYGDFDTKRWDVWDIIQTTLAEAQAKTAVPTGIVEKESMRRVYLSGSAFIPCLRPKKLPSSLSKASPKAIPLLIISGTKDTMFDNCCFASEMFSKAGYPTTFQVIADAEHEWRPKLEEPIWRFFSSHSYSVKEV